MGRFLPPLWGKVRMGGRVKDKAKHLRANMTDTEGNEVRFGSHPGRNIPPPQSSPTRGEEGNGGGNP